MSSRDDVLAFAASVSWIAMRDDREKVLAELAALLPARRLRVPDAHRDDVGDPQLRLSFGNVAETYHRVRPPYSQEVLDRAQAALALDADARVLDLAAGTGRLTSELARRFAHVVAVEPSDAMRALIRDGDVRAGSAEAIPLEDASVDAVFVGEAFHWFDARAAIAEIARVLRPRGGLAVFHTHWWETEPPLPDAALELLRGPWERFAAQRNAPWDDAFDESPFEPLRYERFEEAIDVVARRAARALLDDELARGDLDRREDGALRAGAPAARRRLPAADQARARLDAARAVKRAVVVGAGPNGLAGAVKLAKAGFDVTVHEAAATVGGGCRTAELTLPGFRHDVCAAVLPLARRSPAFAGLELEWIDPPVPAAHALDGDAVTLERDASAHRRRPRRGRAELPRARRAVRPRVAEALVAPGRASRAAVARPRAAQRACDRASLHDRSAHARSSPGTRRTPRYRSNARGLRASASRSARRRTSTAGRFSAVDRRRSSTRSRHACLRSAARSSRRAPSTSCRGRTSSSATSRHASSPALRG